MDVSCHSFVRMARRAAPLMSGGGTLVAMTYSGSQKVIPSYAVMGPVKAALEAAVRYLAYELGPQGIRVHAVSPGRIKTRAASGLKDFDQLLHDAEATAPLHQLVDIDDVGAATAFLVTPYGRHMTGSTLFVDAGLNVMA
jgi:enoyl-[acyl-carrier protein] reductase I